MRQPVVWFPTDASREAALRAVPGQIRHARAPSAARRVNLSGVAGWRGPPDPRCLPRSSPPAERNVDQQAAGTNRRVPQPAAGHLSAQREAGEQVPMRGHDPLLLARVRDHEHRLDRARLPTALAADPHRQPLLHVELSKHGLHVTDRRLHLDEDASREAAIRALPPQTRHG